MEPFQNPQIIIEDLPAFQKVKWQPIAVAYKRVVWFNLLLVNSILILAVLAFFYFFSKEFPVHDYWWVLPILIAVLLLHTYLTLISFKRKSFVFRKHDAMYRSGIISEVNEIIPYNRLQHVVLKQGWLSRSLGLATLKMYTAASGGSISIPGIVYDEAERIKHLLLDKINSAELNDSIPESETITENTSLNSDQYE